LSPSAYTRKNRSLGWQLCFDDVAAMAR
jgi:hypothetical protein